ncbi:hypothetical protein [Peribacillus frigoritolerans]|uniref:hypothetical protein n=1 Tax=Peribacillus castrilensis TaxID=2897690 RepID=UPI003DA6120D
MKINVEIGEEIKAIEVLIRNHEWNEEVQELMERRRGKDRILSAEKENAACFPGGRNLLFVHRARFHNGTDETGDFRNERKVI